MAARARVSVVLVAAIAWAWLAMLLTHELGHIVAVPLTGGELTYVNVYPGQIPSTLAGANPRPGVVLWAGFFSGWLIPQGVALLLRGGILRHAARCWAGFCWVANGAYLAFGGLERFADTAQLIRLGWSAWLLVPAGVAAAVLGYWQFRAALPRLYEQFTSQLVIAKQAAAAWTALLVWIAAQWGSAAWLSQSIAR